MPEENGRWWELADFVLVLVPDEVSAGEHYARVSRDGLHRLQLYEDLRAALDSE